MIPLFFCEKTAIRITGATIHYLDNTLDLMLKAFSNAVQKVCQASIVRFFLNTATSLVDAAKIFQICFRKLYILFHINIHADVCLVIYYLTNLKQNTAFAFQGEIGPPPSPPENLEVLASRSWRFYISAKFGADVD